jgi:isopentenyl diphosphate isomerase/L-lactate dehydrogenase-like FMN-dependent dehydrogenase
MNALHTELAVLEAAGDLQLNRQLTLPPTAADHLPDLTARAITNLAASPFAVTPVYAGDHNAALQAMQVLPAAAAAQERKVLWCTSTDEHADIARHADVADTVTDIATAHRRIVEREWNMLAGALLVVDRADAADPAVLADLAAHAEQSRPA